MNQKITANVGREVGTVVCTTDTPTFTEVTVHLNHNAELKPGDLVTFATNGATYLHGRVVDGYEYNPNLTADATTVYKAMGIPMSDMDEAYSSIIHRRAQIDLIEESSVSADGKVVFRSPETLPRSGTPVFLMDAAQVAEVLGLASSPNDDLFIGWTVGGQRVPVAVKLSSIQRHWGIFGRTGSGKSYARGTLAEELHRNGLIQVNIDVTGEMEEATKELGGVNLHPGTDFSVRLSSLTESEVLEMIPGIAKTNAFELVTKAFLELSNRKVEKHIDFNLKDLDDKLAEVADQMSMKGITLTNAQARTKAIGYHDFIGQGIDWSTYLRPGAIINILCNEMSLTSIRLVTAAVARELTTLRQQGKVLPFVFSLDEAHLLVPTDHETACGQVLREMIRIGRHWGIGVILVTQSPMDIDRKMVRQCNTNLIFALDKEQLDALKGVYSDATDEMIKRLPKLGAGNCLLSGGMESIRHAIPIQIRTRMTTHGGATPDILTELKKAGWSKQDAMIQLPKDINEL